MPVVDASVWVSRFLHSDVHHESSKKWFDMAVEEQLTLYAPTILLPEVSAAIARQGTGTASEKIAAEVVAVIQESGVKLVEVSLALANRAALIGSQHRVRGCDAIYLALAQQLDEPLITLDKQQQERGRLVVETSEP